VRHADELVGALVAELRAHELMQDTLFVVTSDHGKELGEHGLVGHGHTLYEELLRVPLVVRVPGRSPARIRRPASLVDVVPTVLDVLDLAGPDTLQGTSLLALADGRTGERPLWAEVDNMAVKQALRLGAQKTIFGPLGRDVPFPNEREEESYDLAADPGEHAPLAGDPARLARVLEHGRALRELGASLASGALSGTALGAAARAQIEGLGYTLGGDE
jgi:arylsulfatase A-like enzyme